MDAEVVAAAGDALSMTGDRGIRETAEVPLEAYLAFGAAIRAFQTAHPDTLVRTTQAYSRSRGVGRITVRWWQRGTEMP